MNPNMRSHINRNQITFSVSNRLFRTMSHRNFQSTVPYCQTTKLAGLPETHDFVTNSLPNTSVPSARFPRHKAPIIKNTIVRPTNSTMPKDYSSLLSEPIEVSQLKDKSDVFKICTYNVASVRAASIKGLLEYVAAEDPLILCLQETKLQVSPDSKSAYKFEQYPHQVWWCSTARKGYSGTAVLSKLEPISHISGFIQNPSLDNEGRVISVEFSDFYVVNAYVPFVGMAKERLTFRIEWEQHMLNHINALESRGKPVIYTGDLNVAPEAIDVAPALRLKESPGCTSEERKCFEKLLQENGRYPRIDVDRHFHPNELQRYTAYSYMPTYRKYVRGWRFDYFIASRSLLPYLLGTEIRFDCFGASDHVPSVLWLKAPSK